MKPRKRLERHAPLRQGKPLARTELKRNGPVKPRKPTTTSAERIARRTVRARSQGVCERCGMRQATEFHHRRNRSQGGEWTTACGVDLCHTCHAWIGDNPAASYTLGWLVPNGATPEAWPVLRLGSWQQPGERWRPAQPHPRQLELGAGAA